MSDTIKQECRCCATEDDCVNGLCLNCSTYIENMKKRPVINESIFSSDSLVVPLAEVHHIEKYKNENSKYLMVIMNGTKYNFEHDTWENAIYIPERLMQSFLHAFCMYRHEKDGINNK